jgi:hypothetical protein
VYSWTLDHGEDKFTSTFFFFFSLLKISISNQSSEYRTKIERKKKERKD